MKGIIFLSSEIWMKMYNYSFRKVHSGLCLNVIVLKILEQLFCTKREGNTSTQMRLVYIKAVSMCTLITE